MQLKQTLSQKFMEGRSREFMEGHRRIITTIKALIVAVVIMYTPYNMLTLTRSYYVFYKHTYPGETIDKLEALSIYPVQFFGIFNAVMYRIGNKEVKRYVRHLFRRNRNSVRDLENQ